MSILSGLAGKVGKKRTFSAVSDPALIKERVLANIGASRAVREEKALLAMRSGGIRVPNSENPLTIGEFGIPALRETIEKSPIHRFDPDLNDDAWSSVLDRFAGRGRGHLLRQHGPGETSIHALGPMYQGTRGGGALSGPGGIPVIFSGGRLSRGEYEHFDSTLRALVRDYPEAGEDLHNVVVSGLSHKFSTADAAAGFFDDIGQGGIYYPRMVGEKIDSQIILHARQTEGMAKNIKRRVSDSEEFYGELADEIPYWDESVDSMFRVMDEVGDDIDDYSRNRIGKLLEGGREHWDFERPLSSVLNHEYGHAVHDSIAASRGLQMDHVTPELSLDMARSFGAEDIIQKTFRGKAIDESSLSHIAGLITGSSYAQTNAAETFAETFRLTREIPTGGEAGKVLGRFEEMIDAYLHKTPMPSSSREIGEISTAYIRQARENPQQWARPPINRRRTKPDRVKPIFSRSHNQPGIRDHAVREI